MFSIFNIFNKTKRSSLVYIDPKSKLPLTYKLKQTKKDEPIPKEEPIPLEKSISTEIQRVFEPYFKSVTTMANTQNDNFELLLKALNGSLKSMSKAQNDSLDSVAKAQNENLAAVTKAQNDLSIQVEEIYDILQNIESDKEMLRNEKSRINGMLKAILGLSDMIEDFYNYTRHSENAQLLEQAALMVKNADVLLESCAISRIGKEGHQLDPGIHSVQSAEVSDLPRETISRILRSGYRCKNEILRKAVVIVSLGKDVEQ